MYGFNKTCFECDISCSTCLDESTCIDCNSSFNNITTNRDKNNLCSCSVGFMYIDPLNPFSDCIGKTKNPRKNKIPKI
jgi:hypothetical protein